MGKAKSKGLDVNTDAYKWKQLQYKFGGQLPDELRVEMIEATTNSQLMNYQMAYGVFNRVWREIVVPILVEKKVSSAMWGPYKAFTNELLKRALGLGRQRPTMTVDEVKTKWQNLGLSKDVLDSITTAIQSKGAELKIFG
jgi:hypothetical protein